MTYFLDREEGMVRDRNLADDDVNTLFLNNKWIIVEKFSGKISKEMAEEIIQKINQLIS